MILGPVFPHRRGSSASTWVIHTVQPAGADFDEDVALLVSCHRESLTVAADLGARSSGFAKMAWPGPDAAVRSRAATVAISEAIPAPDPVDHVVFASPDPVMIQMCGAALRQPRAVAETRQERDGLREALASDVGMLT